MDNKTPQVPSYPWRIDTNDRYRELISSILTLSTGSLILPVFLVRDFLGIPNSEPLQNVFSWQLYWSAASFGLAIFSCVFFYYCSPKWIRLAWDKPVSLFHFKPANGNVIERCLDYSLFLAVIFFILGLVFLALFLFSHPS